MKSSKLKQKTEPKKKVFSKKKLVLVEDPSNMTAKFKNEVFNKLMERNLENQERLNTGEFSERPQMKDQRNSSAKKSLRIPRSNSAYRRENSYSNRNRLSSNSKRNYYENLSKSRKNLLEMVPDQDDPELYPTNVIRAKKVFRDPYSANKFREYPNLIGGVLTQANFYNVNENKNYNDSIRYKPLDDIFNEQSSIFSRKVNDNNNSSNMSFNSDLKRDQRPEQTKKRNSSRNNNIRKIKIDENNNSTIDNNTINTINTINDSNDKEIKIKRNSIKDRKSETFENNGKKLSPIVSKHNSIEIQRENTNDMIKEYIKTYNKNNNIKEKENNKKNINSIPKKSEVEKDNEAKKKDLRNLLKIENINNFSLYNHENNNNKNAFSGNLKQSLEEDFVICKSYDMNRDLGMENEKPKNLNYSYKKSKGEKNIRNDDNDGKLSFNNDDEILNYIKKKIKEEKENEYYKGKMKYNYFILTKKFHGKVLYEIGLENDLNEINNILRKENVEVEHEPVAFITLKELAQLKDTEGYKEIERLKNDNLKLKEEIEKLNQENKKLQKDIDIMNVQNKKFNNKNNDESQKLREEIEKIKEENVKLKNKLNTQKENLEGNSPLINDNNKLMDELSKLNEKNKEIEHQLKEKQNLIEEYEYEIKILKEKEKEKEKDKDKDKDKGKEGDSKENEKLIEENKRLQAEREKFIKYIKELNEYDEKVITEYKKVKAQLQIEIQKNNLNKYNDPNVKKYFTNRELGIISNKMINIVTSQNKKQQPKNKKSENVIDFMDSVEIMNTKPEGKDEMTQTQEENSYYKDFYDENKGSYRSPLNSNTKQSIRESRDDKKFRNKKLPLKNEDYIDDNKKKKKVGFND